MHNDQTEVLEHLKRFLDEFSSIRSELKEITQKLGNMEKSLDYTFPQYKEIRLKSKPIQTSVKGVDFKKLKKELKQCKDEHDFDIKMQKYADNIVVAFALHLGVAGTDKMDKAEALEGIKKKLNASLATDIGHKTQPAEKGKTGDSQDMFSP